MKTSATLFLLCALAACQPSPSSAPTPTIVSFGDGLHHIAVDVPPGTYRSIRAAPTTGEFCYWERLSGFGGTQDEVIANGAGVGPRVVSIAASDAGFSSEGCGTWTSSLVPLRGPIGDGVWIVGVDVPPGSYRSNGGVACVWQRLSGFEGTADESIEAGQSATVTIASTDRGFTSMNCGTWTRTGG